MNGAQMFLSFCLGFCTKPNYCAIIIRPKCIMDDSMRSQIRATPLLCCCVKAGGVQLPTVTTYVTAWNPFLKIVSFLAALLLPTFLWRQIMA